MALNKANTFPADIQELALIAKALGHPARIAILQTLAQRNSCICGEIVEVLTLSQATVSQHLKALKEAGLVTGEVEGVKSCYCINYSYLQSVAPKLTQLLTALCLPNTECC